MTLASITTLVFDFDGTLATCPYDFAQMRRSVLQAAIAHGINPAQLGELGLLETIDVGVELLGREHPRAIAFHAEAMRRLCAIEYEAAGATVLLPGIVEALDDLRAAGYRLGIVTRNSAAAVERIIGDTPLAIDAFLSREHVERPKPHPEHARQMLRLLESTPATALMIGDHPMDVEMGKAAGMGTVAVLTGQSGAATLGSATPDLLLPSVLELANLLLDGTVGMQDSVH